MQNLKQKHTDMFSAKFNPVKIMSNQAKQRTLQYQETDVNITTTYVLRKKDNMTL